MKENVLEVSVRSKVKTVPSLQFWFKIGKTIHIPPREEADLLITEHHLSAKQRVLS